jgi:putative membrane protein
MIRTTTTRFHSNRFLQGLCIGFGLIWGLLAIEPVDRSDWLLENVLVLLAVGGLAATYRRLPLSNASYMLIALFLLLHVWGAHYCYNTTPLDRWLRGWWLGLERNPYDRLVHLSYGLLMAYPLWEAICRLMKPDRRWSYAIAVMAVLATGAFYELIEMWVALLAAPELGTLFIGSQGDPWDAHHDMELELFGSIVVMLGVSLAGHQPDFLK